MRRLLGSKGFSFAEIFRPSSKTYRYLGFNTVGSECLIISLFHCSIETPKNKLMILGQACDSFLSPADVAAFLNIYETASHNDSGRCENVTTNLSL